MNFTKKIYKNYIAGNFIESKNSFEVINPFDNKAIAKCYNADKMQVESAISSAEKAKKAMRNLPSYKKYKILKQIAETIQVNSEKWAKILSMESGKVITSALGEVNRAVQTFTVAAEESKRPPGEFLQLDWTEKSANKQGIVKYFPKGIVAGITPFNFPLNLVAHKIAPAIAAGCPIVLKPDPRTPLSALLLAEAIDQTDLPKGALSIFCTDIETAAPLIKDERIKVLSFTGSAKAGWEIKKNAGKKAVLLELGGNAGLIISETANIQSALERSLVGGFAYNGQVCIHTQRILVHKKHFKTFTEQYIKLVKTLTKGNPLDKKTGMSTMIDEKGAKKVDDWVEEAKKQGAIVLLGGKRDGSYYPPTILTNTNNKMKVSCEEIFGPVVLIEAYTDFKKAVAEINNSRYGLQAGIFTDSQAEINYAFNEIEVGGLIINDIPTFRVDQMPYGGVKDSGFGREGLKYAMLDYMEPRVLVCPIL